jgi:hypothetical protein
MRHGLRGAFERSTLGDSDEFSLAGLPGRWYEPVKASLARIVHSPLQYNRKV